MDIICSIIIPNKNCILELERALSSIPDRPDIEIIIIDDNSDPSVVDFSSYPGLYRNNTHIIFSKSGKGAGAARNEGLKVAKGKWLMFVDSDDLLTPDFSNLLDFHKESEADIVFFMVDSCDSETMAPSNRHRYKQEQISLYHNNKEELEKFLRYDYTEPWGKLFKKSFIDKNKIEFEESLVANDYRFSIMTGYHASTIEFDSSIIYCVTVRLHSLSNNRFEEEWRVKSRLEVYDGVQKFAYQHNIPIYPLYGYIVQILLHYTHYKHLIKEHFNYLRKIEYDWLIVKSFSRILFNKIRHKVFKSHVIP